MNVPALRALQAFVLTLLILPSPGRALQEHSLLIERFDATLTVGADGWLDVREEVRVRFSGSWNGIFRDIPVEYRTQRGFSYRLVLDDIRVADPDGAEMETRVTRERHYRRLRIRVPGASDATRTVVIRYRIPNALKYFDDHDELYWNVTGDEWEVPIASASATVILPAGATSTRTASWTERGRDPKPESIAPEYEPPEGLTPAEAGTLIDNRPDMRDITAALVDLAVRGYFRIEEGETPERKGLAKRFAKPEYTLVPARPREEWEGLRSHEREILRGVFGKGEAGTPDPVVLSSLMHEFHKHLKDVKTGIFDELVGRGYYERRPDKVLEVRDT